MNKTQIQALIDEKIKGQGNQVDSGGALATILGEILNMASAGANVQSDWDESDNTDPSFIKNKPTIPAAQVQSDWAQDDNEEVDFIKNKPVLYFDGSSGSENTFTEEQLESAIAFRKLGQQTPEFDWLPRVVILDDSTAEVIINQINNEAEGFTAVTLSATFLKAKTNANGHYYWGWVLVVCTDDKSRWVWYEDETW